MINNEHSFEIDTQGIDPNSQATLRLLCLVFNKQDITDENAVESRQALVVCRNQLLFNRRSTLPSDVKRKWIDRIDKHLRSI